MNVGTPGAGEMSWFYGILGFMLVLAVVLVIYGRRRRWFASNEELRDSHA